MSGRCVEGVWKVYRSCLEGIWKVSGRCLEGAWEVPASVQVCKYASMKLCKYSSIQVCKYASMPVCQKVISSGPTLVSQFYQEAQNRVSKQEMEFSK